MCSMTGLGTPNRLPDAAVSSESSLYFEYLNQKLKEYEIGQQDKT